MNLLRLSLWNVVVLLLVTCWFLTALEFLVHWTVAFPRIVIGAIVAVLQELLWLVIGVEAVWNGYCRLFLFTPVNAKIFSVASFRCIITIKYRFYTFCVRILLSALLAFFKFFLSTSPEVRVACRVPDLDVTKVLRSVSAHTLQTMLRPDRIVEVLLTHIALCGPQGASPAQVLVFIEDYFHGLPLRPAERPFRLTRKLQENVWSWLTANPEASVGKNRKWNSLTLAEAERLQAQSDLSAATEQSQEEDAFRVFVSEDRIWQAITGEKRDDTSVTGLEYELLCIIAARKSQGVLQTELIQLSGQDKRSVPKRTDSLQRKGYIEKRPVQAKSVKTSLCTLWRFVNQIPTFSVTQTPAERESKAHQDDSDIIDTKTFVEQIFNVLKEHEIISRNDLKRALGLQDVWRWRILSRTIRKFEVIGCVKRVKAESQYNDTMKATHPCVLLVREPTERDLALFFEDTRQLYTNLDQDNEDDDIDAANQEIVKDPNRKVIQWAPERVHPNIIQDIVTQSGTAGTTNIKLVKKGYGSFFRRSVETTMARLSEAAQYSQPPWLRSKAIVRDVDIDGTTIHYVHYAFPNFAEKVEKGEAKWEAVEFRPKDTKSQTLKMPSFEAKPELDNDGLPPLLRTNRLPGTSLLNVVTTLEPPDHLISVNDPTLARGKDGKLILNFNENDGRRRRLPYVSEMMSILVEYDSRENHPSRSREGIVEKAEEAEGSGSNIVLPPVGKKPRTSKKSRFEGMTLKESYEAFGMDMGWTNYSALVMERPTPGIYVTPKGKARPFHNPLGRGRNREPSQIAIFKTTKLSQLPWFQAETEGDATPSEPVLSQEVSGENKGTAAVHSAEGFTESSSDPNHLDERSRIGRDPLRPFDLQAIRDNSTAHETVSESSQQVHPTFEVAPTTLPPKGASSSNRKKSKSHHYEKKRKAAVYNAEEAIASSSKTLGHDIENTSEAQLPRDKDSNHIPGMWPEDPTSEAVPAEKPHKTAVPEATRAKGKKAPVAYDLPSDSSDALSQKLPSDDGENPISQNDVKLPDAEPALFVDVWPPKEVSSKYHQDTVTPEVQQSEDENVVNVIDNPSDVAAGESHGVSTEISTRPEEEDVHVEDNTTPYNEKKEDGINITPISNEAVEGPHRKESQAFSSRSRKLRVDRGGSIAVLRREIVMDIVKKAGGAFPLGTELWHAFITVWMRTDHKEKPDARTVRSTARYLIDAGKLRQQTFSGKDNKGVMVTKDIIMDPAISPDDPVVKNLQKDMLAAGKYFLPAGVEVNPRVSKASRMAAPAAPRGRIQKLPFQAGITVQLHQKPAFVIAQEKREARSLQRRLFRAMESGAEHGDQFGGPIRLRTIQRSRRVDGKTSVSRPAFRIAPNGQSGQIPGTLTWLGASSMEATSGQVPVEQVTRYELFGNKRRMIPQSLEEIFTQVKRRKTTASASFDPRTAEFFKESDVISKWELQNETLFDSKGERLAYINQTVGGAFEAAPVEGGIHFDIDETSMPPPPLPPRKITRQIARAPRRDSALQLRQLAAASPVEPLPVVWPPPEQADGELDRGAMAQNTKQPAARAPFRRRSRKASNLPESLILKLKHAIVVIQMLLGGGTSIIDWAVVTSLFPDYDPEVIHKRGKAIALRDKEQLKQMAAHFDEAFIPAYLNDEVPSVNYDDLESYPWDTVVEWAMAQSDIRPSQRVPELPATREEFDRLYEIRLDRPIFKDIHTLFTNNPKMTVAKRQALLASVPYVVPLKDKWSKRTEPTDKNIVKDSTVQEKVMHQDVTTSPIQDIAKKQESSTTAQKETLSQSDTATKQPDENNLQDETTTVPKTRSAPEEVTASITKDEATPIEETTYIAPAEPSISQETSDRYWNEVRPETDDQMDDMLQDESHTAEAEPVGKAAEVAQSQQDAVQDEDSSESELSEHGSSEFDSSEEEWIDVIPKMDDTLQDIHVQNTDAVQQDEHVASAVPGTSQPEDSHVQQDVHVAPEPPVAWQPEGRPKQGPAPTLQQEVQVQEMTTTPEVDMEDAPLDTSQQDISSVQERATEQNGDTMDIDGPEYVARDGQNAAQTARRAEIEQLEVAKSWVRANVVARDDTYNAANAKWHLDRFPAPLINDALTALITERVIAQSNRGRITPGRNYTMTELFLSTLGKRRAIDSTMLHEASEFKRRVLDYDLRYHGFSEVRYNARDGDILALICLAEDRRIHISPANEPREPFGMTEGGYETRVIDKKKYHFAVRVRPMRGRYDYGNPVRGRIAHLPPPKGSARYAMSPASPAPPPWRPGELPAKPPLWYGINGGLVKSVWDLCVSSVVGIVAVRPHLDAAGIVDMVRPMMASWDVEHILGWLHEAGVLVPVGKGWVVREYWWMIVV